MSALSGKAAIVGIGATEFSKESGAPSSSSPSRPSSTRSPTAG